MLFPGRAAVYRPYRTAPKRNDAFINAAVNAALLARRAAVKSCSSRRLDQLSMTCVTCFQVQCNAVMVRYLDDTGSAAQLLLKHLTCMCRTVTNGTVYICDGVTCCVRLSESGFRADGVRPRCIAIARCPWFTPPPKRQAEHLDLGNYRCGNSPDMYMPRSALAEAAEWSQARSVTSGCMKRRTTHKAGHCRTHRNSNTYICKHSDSNSSLQSTSARNCCQCTEEVGSRPRGGLLVDLVELKCSGIVPWTTYHIYTWTANGAAAALAEMAKVALKYWAHQRCYSSSPWLREPTPRVPWSTPAGRRGFGQS